MTLQDPVIISAVNSFHGRTLAALSATAQPKYHKGFGYGGKMVPGFAYAEYNNVADLERVFAEMNQTPADLPEGRKRAVAAIILEALQGEGGVIPATKEYLTRARQLCDESNALLICDEVQVGMGRSGKLWGYQNLDVEPDVFTSAKALGGGVPIGAMMAKGEAASVFHPGDHASTYGGNPLACAAGLAVAKYFCDHDILRNVRERSQQLISGLDLIASRHSDILGGVRGWGLLLGIVIKDETLQASNIVQAAMEQGLLLVPAGPKVVRFVPPLIVSQEEVDKALQLFEQAVISAAAAIKK
jgi:acetylornithine aminotransferase